MSSTVRWDVADSIAAATASQTIAANGTVAFDFGTPNDVDLRGTAFAPGDRVAVVLTAKRAAGTTSTLAFTIEDAPDNAGAIGTPAAASTDGTLPSMAADSGAVTVGGIVSVQVKPGRPWIRVNAVHGVGGTDSFQAHATILGVPSGV